MSWNSSSVTQQHAPYYGSTKFREFAVDWRFTHTMLSPYHSLSNGKAESAVKIIKNLFKTAEDPWKAMLEWRAGRLSSMFSTAAGGTGSANT